MKLLASSATIEGIKKLISEYFYQENIELETCTVGVWHIVGKSSQEYLVFKKSKRYHFKRSI